MLDGDGAQSGSDSMSHPDKYAVGLVAIGMGFVALILLITFSIIAFLNAYRVLPLRRSRTVFWIGMIVIVPAWLATFLVAPKFVHALAVVAEFGWDAYAEGLRVVNKHGLLSDGRFLSVFWAAASGVLILVLDFVWAIPVTAWYCHFNPGRKLHCGVAAEGIVRLDGKPVGRAVVTFHIVAGQKLRAYASVKTDESGRYEFRWLPLHFRVTVASREILIPSRYGEPERTPLEFNWNKLGPITQDLELQSG
jgi:hypothetical protein